MKTGKADFVYSAGLIGKFGIVSPASPR